MLNGRVDIMNLYFCVVSSPFGAVSFQPVCHACLYAGPRFIRDDALGNAVFDVFARHVGNIFYTHAFAEMIFQELILHNARASQC